MILKQIAIAIDQLFNALIGGYADETLSSRAWRLYARHKMSGRIMKPVIDGIFFWQKDHCYMSFLAEVERRQLPREFRE